METAETARQLLSFLESLDFAVHQEESPGGAPVLGTAVRAGRRSAKSVLAEMKREWATERGSPMPEPTVETVTEDGERWHLFTWPTVPFVAG